MEAQHGERIRRLARQIMLGAGIAVAAWTLFACARPQAAMAPAPSSTPVQTAAPTPTPSPTATPAPTPKITDEWYEARTASMRHYMALYGGYSGAALDARVRDMEIDPDKPMIALTFDDGPIAGVTDPIVDILARHNCRATFFILGARIRNEATAPLLQKILGEGNEIGNHTWQHLNLKTANGSDILSSMKSTNEAVYDATGYTVRLLRPPGGRVSANVDRYAGRLGMSVVLWSQSGNVHEKDPARIAENVQRQIVNGKALEDGDIVLLHDTKARMIEAVEIMVPQLLDQGYQLVTVSELLSLSETGLVPGTRYYRQDP